MLKRTFSFFWAALFPVVLLGSPKGPNDPQSVSRATQESRKKPILSLVRQYENPVITVHSPGAEDIKYGFEDGRVVKIGNKYHLITTEMFDEPDSRRAC
jgi:predicted GH43/DUF377 family glycosyl hydrolase